MLIEYCTKRQGVIGIDINCNECPFKPMPYGNCEFYRVREQKGID